MFETMTSFASTLLYSQSVYTASPVLVSLRFVASLSCGAFYWIKNDEPAYLDRSYSVGVDVLTYTVWPSVVRVHILRSSGSCPARIVPLPAHYFSAFSLRPAPGRELL